MADNEKVIKGLEELEGFLFKEYTNIKAEESKIYYDRFKSLSDAIDMLKAQETVKQKMWNALYVEEDRLEKKYVGTDNHDDWFFVFRPWLQRGFEIALKVFTNQEG